MLIRNAAPNEARELSELAFRSKGHWPYDKKNLEEYRKELEVFEEDILSDSVFVLEDDGKIVGFYGLSSDLKKERLHFLFIDPPFIGKGFGKSLWLHAVSKARSRGWRSLSLYADSYAKEFYAAQGCQVVGSIDSKLGKLVEMTVDLNREL